MKAIHDIIASIKSKPRLNPTEIYNEGWITRLLVHYSVQENLTINGIDFGKLNNWTSEALISSPFVFAKTHREGYTHADMSVGDFDVDYATRGEVVIRENAQFFGIIEAKMGSNLSQGTTTVPIGYNQASRNVACIASKTFTSSCEVFFAVVAPADVLVKHEITEQLKQIRTQIEARFHLYEDKDDTSGVLANREAILKKVDVCKVWSLSYEEWIAAFADNSIKQELTDFYTECRKWNRLK